MAVIQKKVPDLVLAWLSGLVQEVCLGVDRVDPDNPKLICRIVAAEEIPFELLPRPVITFLYRDQGLAFTVGRIRSERPYALELEPIGPCTQERLAPILADPKAVCEIEQVCFFCRDSLCRHKNTRYNPEALD